VSGRPPESTALRNWTVTPYEPSDLPALARFFKRNFTGPESYGSMGLFYWKIVDNYAGPGMIRLIKDEGQIVSVLSAAPKLLYFMGRERKVAELCDALTDSSYRRKGLFALLDNQITKDVLDSGIPFIYGTPNLIALPGHEKKANYRTIPGIKLKSLIIPLDPSWILENKNHWLIAKYASALFSSLALVYFLWKKLILNAGSLPLEECRDVPEGWDEFWEQARSRYDFILARSKRAIQWRYLENPNRYRFYVLRENGRIVASLISRIMHDANVTSLVVADYLCLPGRERDLVALLFRILDDAQKSGAAKINVWCPEESPYYPVFKRFGFIERSEIPVIAYHNDFAVGIQKSCHSWHFTIGDSDNV
jgi:hypothetical protein